MRGDIVKLGFLIAALLVVGMQARAQIPPPSSAQMPGDPRIQTIPYDSRKVYPLEIASTFTLMIGLAAGERVETMAVGDSAAWQVTANKRGDAIFIKRNYSGITTNLTVITDTRTYVFELLGNTPSSQTLPLIIRFTYPEPVREAAQPADADAEAGYRLKGARLLRPSIIAVKGNTVSLGWPPGAPIPAVFQINDDGTEALVNGGFADDRMVIQGVPERILFRSGRPLATATRIAPPKVRQ
jgi:type IV secretion system protein VirB9